MALPPVTLRKKVEYKKPRRLNAVSGIMALAFGRVRLLRGGLWPLLALRSNVKDELADARPTCGRSTCRAEGVARRELIELRKKLLEELRKAGVKDKQMELVVDRNKKEVAMQARYAGVATFPGTTKTIQLNSARASRPTPPASTGRHRSRPPTGSSPG